MEPSEPMSQKMGAVPKFKVVFLGNQSVGKTMYFASHNSLSKATIGIDFVAKQIEIGDKKIKLQLWDTAGQERFRNLIPNYLRDSEVAIIVYDITIHSLHISKIDKESFDSIGYWIKEVKDITTKNAIIVLVGNKSDLEASRVIKKEEGEKLGKENGIIFLEASAKTGENISEIFEKIGHQVISEESSVEKQKPSDAVHLETPLDFAGGPERKVEGEQAVPKKKMCCT